MFNDYFDGHIDEVRVYSRALSAQEITEDMETPVKAIPSSKPPVAAYSLDEGEGGTAHDSSGNGHEATIHGAEWAGGKYGTALRFDASKHDYLSIPDSPELQLSDGFTLEAWVRPASAQAEAPILTKETAESFSYMLDAGGESSGKPEGLVADESSTASVADSEEIPPRAWSYLTLTSDGEDLRLYVNGKLVATAAAKSAQSSEGDLKIGGNQVFGDYFDGLIDEVRVYSRALSAEEIGEDKQTAIETPASQSPVAAYSLDEGEGEVAHDSSGNGHNGTIENAKWVEGKSGPALEFNGENSCITVPNSSELQLTGDFTLEAWFKPQTSGQDAALIAKEAPESFSYALFLGHAESGHPDGGVADGPLSSSDVSSSKALPAGSWSHLGLTSDGEHLRLYINGKLDATATAKSARSSEGTLEIGCSKALETYFDGLMNEVRIYDRALSELELQNDSVSDHTPPE